MIPKRPSITGIMCLHVKWDTNIDMTSIVFEELTVKRDYDLKYTHRERD